MLRSASGRFSRDDREAARQSILLLPHLDDGRYIPLTRGKVLIVPLEKHEELAAFEWMAVKPRHKFYAVRKDCEGRFVYAHRQIMQAPDELEVDHVRSDVPEDGLDCRWNNLRLATRSQNSANRGANKNRVGMPKSVYWDTQRSKWKVVIGLRVDGKKVNTLSKRFDLFEDACAAALAEQKRLHGEFARIE